MKQNQNRNQNLCCLSTNINELGRLLTQYVEAIDQIDKLEKRKAELEMNILITASKAGIRNVVEDIIEGVIQDNVTVGKNEDEIAQDKISSRRRERNRLRSMNMFETCVSKEEEAKEKRKKEKLIVGICE